MTCPGGVEKIKVAKRIIGMLKIMEIIIGPLPDLKFAISTP
jgi:hypothetical protein